MRGALKQMMARLLKGQGGFTLIEMLVVIGIIITLTAIIVPSVAKFAGKGNEGAKDAEAATVQTALYSMMAGQGIESVTAAASGSAAVQDWTTNPAGTGALTLDNYLDNSTTVYYYCYDNSGKITSQYDAATTC